jgi:hypothetical protein
MIVPGAAYAHLVLHVAIHAWSISDGTLLLGRLSRQDGRIDSGLPKMIETATRSGNIIFSRQPRYA